GLGSAGDALKKHGLSWPGEDSGILMNTTPSAPSTRWTVPVGDETTTALFDRAEAPLDESLLVLGHGASTDMEHRGMANLAGQFRSRGLHVVRFNFLYTEKKKGPPDRMPRLMECFAAVVEKARAEVGPRHLFIGGHSMGG